MAQLRTSFSELISQNVVDDSVSRACLQSKAGQRAHTKADTQIQRASEFRTAKCGIRSETGVLGHSSLLFFFKSSAGERSERQASILLKTLPDAFTNRRSCLQALFAADIQMRAGSERLHAHATDPDSALTQRL